MSACAKRFCDSIFVPKGVEFFQTLDKLDFALTKLNKSAKPYKFIDNLKKTRKFLRSTCMNKYCNPGCGDTVFTTAHDSATMKRIIREKLDSISSPRKAREITAIMTKLNQKNRKTIKKYKNPLKNNFYQGISSTHLKMLKRSGASSGCVVEVDPFLSF